VKRLAGCRFIRSNMVPFFTGIAAPTATAGTSGSLATNADYRVIVTGSDNNTQYETLVSQTQASLSVTGPNGSIQITTPATTGYTYNVYIGVATAPVNLGVTISGPTTGPLQGQAVQIPPSTTVTITAVGTAKVPPAAPASGVTVYPNYFFGRGAYGQVKLEDIKTSFLTGPDKSDPLNQQRVIGWKVFYGTIILNNQFFARIESASAFSSTFG
jgi:hypothetical protein